MLLAILLVSLLIYAWSMFSKYQTSKDELVDIEDTAKFNEQFTNYDRDGVQGYELVTLINQVIDYNSRKSNVAGAKNDEKYPPITIKINLNNQREKLTKDGKNQLFIQNSYLQSDINNTLKEIIDATTEIEKRYGGVDAATKISRSIDSIFLSKDQIDIDKKKYGLSDENILWENAIKKFNSITKGEKAENQNQLMTYERYAYQYYEYVQFKRGKFNCSLLEYDNATGRVKTMQFDFTGDIY